MQLSDQGGDHVRPHSPVPAHAWGTSGGTGRSGRMRSPRSRGGRYTPPRRTRRSTVYVGPELSEALTPAQRETVVRRRLVAITGRCPCGARLAIPDNLAPGTVTHVRVEHQPGCPAVATGTDP